MKKVGTIFKKINTNSLVAASAVFISLCALFISIQEIRIMRVQQKATMYPYITLGFTYNNDGFGVELKNSGNGLAKINSYKVFNDSIYFKDWMTVLNSYMPEAKTINYSIIKTSGNIKDQMISPGEVKQLIFIQWNEETRILQPKLEDLQITIAYESLLGENWFVKEGIPKQMESINIINEDEEFGI